MYSAIPSNNCRSRVLGRVRINLSFCELVFCDLEILRHGILPLGRIPLGMFRITSISRSAFRLVGCFQASEDCQLTIVFSSKRPAKETRKTNNGILLSGHTCPCFDICNINLIAISLISKCCGLNRVSEKKT